MSENQKLDIVDTIKDGVGIGIKNIGPIIVNFILWGLTCWIPYLNVGTTIGLYVGIVAKASKGDTISFLEIFDAKYRKYMGEFFLTFGLISMGTVVGVLFAFIPGIVIGLAWSLAILLVIDKGKNPAEALTLSNNCTYGNKWRMVGVYFLISMVAFFAMLILIGLAALVAITGAYGLSIFLGIIFYIAFFIVAGCVFIGIQSSIYKRLAANV